MKKCDSFYWIGQSWEHCDNCGRPWHEHKGLRTLRKEASPFGPVKGDEWYTMPWSKIDDNG